MSKRTPPIIRDDSALLTMNGLAPKCGLPLKAIERLVDDGKIPVIRVEGKQLFDWPAVKAALAELETRTAK